MQRGVCVVYDTARAAECIIVLLVVLTFEYRFEFLILADPRNTVIHYHRNVMPRKRGGGGRIGSIAYGMQ